jgi:hypothetical protein
MMKDPIGDEFDRFWAEQMARYDFNFEAFYRDLKEQERLSPRPVQSPPEASGSRVRREKE